MAKMKEYLLDQYERGQEMTELETAQFWTKAEGEGERVRTFARIPQGWEGKLDQHPADQEVSYWLNEEEWIGLGAGEVYGDVEILSCACDECEFEREAEVDA